jgi:hypothetical protein
MILEATPADLTVSLVLGFLCLLILLPIGVYLEMREESKRKPDHNDSHTNTMTEIPSEPEQKS